MRFCLRRIFMNFWSNLNTPSGILAFLLALGVVFVNGFTDAPNAIATVVSTRALSMNKACLICAACNLFGLALMCSFNMSVAQSIFGITQLSENKSAVLCSVFISVIVFSLASWLFSMPSSESHALLAGVAGASLAASESIDITPFFKIILYMLISCAASAVLSLLISRMLKNAFLPYGRLQIVSCAATSLMHGAQDGQKFIGLLLLLVPTQDGKAPYGIIATVCAVLFFGTLLGGGRIIKSMGGITALSEKSAFISDVSASLTLLACSLFGMAVSTSNIKACSIAGAGLSEGKKINSKILIRMAYTAIITIPCCMLISYLCFKIISR